MDGIKSASIGMTGPMEINGLGTGSFLAVKRQAKGAPVTSRGVSRRFPDPPPA